jgi:hypothetical protein
VSELDEAEVDPYLWTGEGEADSLLARVEGELGSLRWQPRGLPSAGAELVLPSRESSSSGRRRREDRGEVLAGPPRWWPALVTGLAAAAAVFALLAWLRPLPSSQVPDVNPAGSPQLEDPFGSGGGAIEDRARESRGPRELRPDLKDPFASDHADTDEVPDKREDPQPGRRRVSPDLKDPFAGAADGEERRVPRQELLDPYGDAPAERRGSAKRDEGAAPTFKDPFSVDEREANPRSPDLKDPFAR